MHHREKMKKVAGKPAEPFIVLLPTTEYTEEHGNLERKTLSVFLKIISCGCMKMVSCHPDRFFTSVPFRAFRGQKKLQIKVRVSFRCAKCAAPDVDAILSGFFPPYNIQPGADNQKDAGDRQKIKDIAPDDKAQKSTEGNGNILERRHL